MKKNIALLFIAITTTIMAQRSTGNIGEFHSHSITSTGKDNLVNTVIYKEMDINGLSNSNEYIEFVGTGNGKLKNQDKINNTKGIILSTVSNLHSNQNLFAGFSFGYLKSKGKFDDEESLKARTYGFNYTLGYKYNNFLIATNASYGETKNIIPNYKYRTKEYVFGGQGGYLYKLDESTFIYPYIDADISKYSIHGYADINRIDQNIFSTGVGVQLTKKINDKFIISTKIKGNHEYKERKLYNLSKNYCEANIDLGYFIEKDLSINLSYRALFNKKSHYNLIGVSLSHNF